ncbi:MAG: OmpA family protein [bacterium]|nr:OmpA family protein [bacterium]
MIGVALLACSAQRVELVAPEEPAEIATLEELEQEYLPRIEENNDAVDWHETRKGRIVEARIKDHQRLRDRYRILLTEAEGKRHAIALLEQQVADREARLAELERDEHPSPLVGKKSGQIQREIAELRDEIADESAELVRRTAQAEEASSELKRFEGLGEEEIFLDEMQSIYRSGIDLHLDFYRGLIDITRQQLVESHDSVALIEHFSERIARRARLLDQPIEPEAFAALRHEVELDRRISQAWLSAYILEVRFSLSEFSLDTISDEERQELSLVAEALEERWSADDELVMFIDGHADSKKFRGRNDCVSATKNKELSRRRAEAVRDYFAGRLGGSPERIFVDWFGNYSMQTEPRPGTGEVENRRFELRISSMRAGSFGSHGDYFAMRQGLDLSGIRFFRRPGEWVDVRCREEPVARNVEFMSREYRLLAEPLELDSAAIVPLGVDERRLWVRLGNELTVMADGVCVQIQPCPDR